MNLIRFDAKRLPFQPIEKQVIYFDASPYSQKMSFGIATLIDKYYDEICRMFEAEGLEFCFLPHISRTLQLPELLSYFRPDLPPEELPQYLPTIRADSLAKYFANEVDVYRLPAGLIKYTGQKLGDNYLFNYVPFYGDSKEELLMEVKDYLHFNSSIFLENAIKIEKPHFNTVTHEYIEDSCPSLSTMPEVDLYETSAMAVETAEDVDITNMLTQAQLLIEQLRNHGVNDMVIEELFHPTKKLSRLHVKYSRIFLTDYQNMEIKMSPLPKALFLLYLKHPEGIRFCDLPDYRDELLHIYASFSGRDSMEEIRASIDDLTNPLSNSINEKCSRIRQAFLGKFDDRLAENYYITGKRGEAKRILLPRELVTWQE